MHSFLGYPWLTLNVSGLTGGPVFVLDFKFVEFYSRIITLDFGYDLLHSELVKHRIFNFFLIFFKSDLGEHSDTLEDWVDDLSIQLGGAKLYRSDFF